MTNYLLHIKRRGHGPTMVLIHGVAGSSLVWEPLVPILAKYFEVIQIDLLGYGHSPKPHLTYTPQVHTQTIYYTLQHYKIIAPYILIGLSLGALLTLEFAKQWPQKVSKILCIGTPYFTNTHHAQQMLRRSPWAFLALEGRWIGHAAIATTWALGRRSNTFSRWFARGIYEPALAREAAMASYQAFKTSLQFGLMFNRLEPLLKATNRIPQYYLHGQNDRRTPVSLLKNVLQPYRNCHLTIIDSSHNTVATTPKLTIDWVLHTLYHEAP